MQLRGSSLPPENPLLREPEGRRSPSSRDCDTDFVADGQAPGLAHRGEQRFTPSLCHQRARMKYPPRRELARHRQAFAQPVSSTFLILMTALLLTCYGAAATHAGACPPSCKATQDKGTDHTRQTAATQEMVSRCSPGSRPWRF